MPPHRTSPSARPSKKLPGRSERTHEENQERAYIAASRRSDRSLEARVDSARRASEIHKKRTGRSLRVREQDVANEEMYEEEDDDMPSHFRRVSHALYGGQSYTPFDQRVHTFLATQTDIRASLHQAIWQANQSTEQHRLRNQMYQQQQLPHGNSGFIMASPSHSTQQQPHGGSGFITASPSQRTPESSWSPQMATHHQSPEQPRTAAMPDASAMRLSLPNRSRDRRLLVASTPRLSSHPSQSPTQQMPTPRSLSGSAIDDSDPLSTTLPANQQQLLDGNLSLAMRVHPSQMTRDVPMPSTYNYHFAPDAKENNQPGSEQFAFGQRDLSQTLAPQNMQSMQQHVQTPPVQSTPGDLGFDDNMFQDISWSENDFLSSDLNNNSNYSGQETPGDMPWNFDDFLDIPADTSA